MARALLIGYGNPLRGDDALGPIAAEQLRGKLAETEIVVCHQLTPELAESLSRCELALFVDAAANGDPGTVNVQALSAESCPASITHHTQPSALLALSQELYGHAPRAMLITGAGANFESGEGLSDAARVALQEICRIVPALLREI